MTRCFPHIPSQTLPQPIGPPYHTHFHDLQKYTYLNTAQLTFFVLIFCIFPYKISFKDIFAAKNSVWKNVCVGETSGHW